MTGLRRLFALLASLGLLAAALLLVAEAGLPERSDFTGLQIDGIIAAPEIGAVAPPIEVMLLNGELTTLASLRGAPVILNFWATWCVPCEVEMPILQQVVDAYAPDQLHVLAINSGESRTTIEAWLTRLQLRLRVALDVDLRIAAAYQVRGQPQTFIIDRHGVIRMIFFGAVDAETLRNALMPLL